MSAASQADLQAYLADRDVPCPGCQYNLKGLEQSVCPECGVALSLAVVAPQEKEEPGRWIRQATHPVLIFAAVMLAGAAVGKWRGVALAVVVWLAVVMTLRTIVPYLRRYWHAPLPASGDWIWRLFITSLVCSGWILGWLVVVSIVMRN